MTTAEFDRWVKLGLGRAVTRLRAEPDKEPFREIVLRAATRHEGYYTSGEYAYELIHCYDDAPSFVEAVIKNTVFNRADGRNIYIGNEELLVKFYREGNIAAGEKLEELYSQIFADLSAETEKTNDENKKLLPYISISYTLAEIIDAERLRGMFIDMGMLYDKKELFDDSKDSFFIFYSHAHFKFNKAFEAALAGIRAEKDGSFPLGDYFEETAATNFGKLFLGKRSDIPPATFDELYKLVKNASVRIEPQYFELLDILTDKQKIKLALVVKNETDPNRLVNIIWIFTHTSNPWPLDPEILINLLRKYEPYFSSKKHDNIEKRLADALIHVLYILRSDAVRDYALDLVERGYLDEGAALWIKSVYPEDWERIVLLFKKMDFCGFYSAHALISALSQAKLNECEIDLGKTDKSAELLELLYENTNDRVIRHMTVLELRRRGLLTAEIADECRYDVFPPTRQVFSKKICQTAG